MGLPGPGGTESKHDSADSDANLSRDFQQFQTNRATLGLSQIRMRQAVLEPQAQLIALALVGRGAVTA